MNFTHRLAYYLLGLLIGGLFLKFILDYTGGKGLDFAYMPNARVLKNIRNKSFIYNEIAVIKMGQKHIDSTDIKEILTNGDVDFSISNKPFEGGKVYVVEGITKKNVTVKLQVINYENKAILNDILN